MDSNTMLGRIMMMLVKVPGEYLGALFDLIEKLCSRNGAIWFKELLKFLRKELWQMDAEKLLEQIWGISIVTTITVGETGEKMTSDCFTNRLRYYNRDRDLDLWLRRTQRSQEESKVMVAKFEKKKSFKEMAEAVLCRQGNVATLANLLIERKHTTNLQTIEDLVERHVNGGDVGLDVKNNRDNLFFVEDNEGGVVVVIVCCNGGQWRVRVNMLSYNDSHNVLVGRRLFVRNPVA